MTTPQTLKGIEFKEFKEGRGDWSSLYKEYYHYCSSFVLKNNGNQNDARENFQDTLLAFYKNLKNPDFTINAPLRVYLYSINKFQWLNKLRKKGQMPIDAFPETGEDSLPMLAASNEGVQQKVELEAKYEDIANCLDEIGDPCKTLIDLFFYKKISDKEIAPMMDYTVGFVRVRRRRCIQMLKKMVKAA